MSNPVFNTQARAGGASRMPLSGRNALVQIINDTKWSTKTLAIGVAPATTDYFTSSPVADQTIDNYDNANQLVTSGKTFTIQGIAVNVISSSIADVDAVVQKGVIVLTAQNKEIGRYRVRHLNAAGGTFVAGAQVAAASTIGVVNGTPQSEIWRISPITLQTNQSFKLALLMPTTAPYTIIAATSVEVALYGFEERPAA